MLRRPVESAQFGSDDFNRWCKDNYLVPSMSRRGNRWDNAVAEWFFSSLKKERIKRHIYASRQDAKSDVFDYIEGFYNRVRSHSHLGQLSPLAFEQLLTGSCLMSTKAGEVQWKLQLLQAHMPVEVLKTTLYFPISSALSFLNYCRNGR